MKQLITLVLVFELVINCSAQAGMWTWMKGSDRLNDTGYYGIQGVSNPLNEPSPRYACAKWTDTAGNFWVYGGMRQFGSLADLWKFNPNTLMWTWMKGDSNYLTNGTYAAPKGVFHADNQPGCLGFGMFCWVDSRNHFWMYGGARNSAIRNNLWQYDPAINEWAWMGGSQDTASVLPLPIYGVKGVENAANSPGSRYESNTCWIDDQDNLWLFGGGTNSRLYSDLWKYNTTSCNWVWMSGSNQLNSPGSYGPIGVPSANYFPSARYSNFFWKDNSGNFWLIGGAIFQNDIYYQDVWRFNPVTLEWALMNGGPQSDTGSISPVNCREDSLNEEGGRYENRVVWKVCDSLILNYSGLNHYDPSTGYATIQNEIWGYMPYKNEWIRVFQESLTGNYGVKGVPAASNFPPGRIGSAGFIDRNKNLWMYGGGEFENYLSSFGDVWKLNLDWSCFGRVYCAQNCQSLTANIATNTPAICANESTQICAPSGFANYQWNNGASTNCISTSLAGNYYVTVTDNTGCTAESNHLAIVVYPQPPVSISINGDTLSVFNAVTQQWYLNGSAINNATSTTYIAIQGGSYTVQVTDSNGCIATSSPVIISGIDNLSEEDVVSVFPNPLTVGGWQLSVGNSFVGGEAEVFDANGKLVFKFEIRNPKYLPMFQRVFTCCASVQRKQVW